MMDASVDAPPLRSFAFGLERLGLIGLAAPRLTVVLILVVSVLAGLGLTLLRVDDSLSELFRGGQGKAFVWRCGHARKDQ